MVERPHSANKELSAVSLFALWLSLQALFRGQREGTALSLETKLASANTPRFPQKRFGDLALPCSYAWVFRLPKATCNREKRDAHLSIDASPVTLADTGSSCSFLFLPNIISMGLADGSEEDVTGADLTSRVLLSSCPLSLYVFICPSALPLSLSFLPLGSSVFLPAAGSCWVIYTMFGQRSVPKPCVTDNL